MVKSFESKHHPGRKFCFGRLRPKQETTAPRMSAFMPAKSITTPDTCDYSPSAVQSLHNILRNDENGCCVISAGYHVEGVLTGNAGALFVPTNDQVIHDYSAIGNYVVGDPSTDNGCYVHDALSYWAKTGFVNGTKLAGWLAINPANRAEVQSALYLFETLLSATELPTQWISGAMPRGDGFVWDVAGRPVLANGHCVMHMGYGLKGVKTGTWGMIGTLTWRALAKYMVYSSGGELYALVTPDIINKARQKAPNGLDWNQIMSYLKGFGGHIV